MTALPGDDWNESVPPRAKVINTVRHVFTHFSLDLHLVARADPEGEGWWAQLDRMEHAGLPTLYRKAIDAALASNE
ncbi:MAG: hypothetical protein NVS3B5_20010 [Sphingomicrobium sp.]